ncbi:MAG: hypothetical protein NT157_06560 [Candidatus Micrarchaeota archaeon]|nr:hypothetical protein [Candidatus Micrarchaeota archaeon]
MELETLGIIIGLGVIAVEALVLLYMYPHIGRLEKLAGKLDEHISKMDSHIEAMDRHIEKMDGQVVEINRHVCSICGKKKR